MYFHFKLHMVLKSHLNLLNFLICNVRKRVKLFGGMNTFYICFISSNLLLDRGLIFRRKNYSWILINLEWFFWFRAI